MKSTSAYVLLGAILIGVCVVYWRIPSAKNEAPSYWAFSHQRSEKYYSQFADECDETIRKIVGQSTAKVEVRGNDDRLPSLIKELCANSVEVSSNRIWIVVPISAGYGVVWQQDDSDKKVWILTVHGEADPIAVLFRTNR